MGSEAAVVLAVVERAKTAAGNSVGDEWVAPVESTGPERRHPTRRVGDRGSPRAGVRGLVLGSPLLLWSLGPGTVGVYVVGLTVGLVDADGLRHAAAGALFSLLLVPLGFVMRVGGRVGTLAFAARFVLEFLTVLAGAMALRAGRDGATDDPTARRRSARVR